MKKIFLLTFLTVWVSLLSISFSYWETTKVPAQNVVLVTEKVPWANCNLDEKSDMYRCVTARWFGAVLQVMATMLKYFTFLCGLFSVLALVVGWIMYSMWGANEEMKNSAKTYIEKSILWLIVLLLSGSILYAVAPWVFEIA